MSTNVNKGDQILTFDYKNEGSSLSFNKLMKDLLQIGIYAGLDLSIDGGTNKPVISPGVCFIKTENEEWANQLGVRVELRESYIISEASSTLTYIVARLNWAQTEDNYMDVTAVAAPEETDIIIGQGVYSGATLTEFLLTERMEVSPLSNGIDLGSGIVSNPTGGTATSLAGDQTIYEAFLEVFSRLIDLSGVTNVAVKARHLDTGTGATQLNAENFVLKKTKKLVGKNGKKRN
jgi:hypothetical protein